MSEKLARCTFNHAADRQFLASLAGVQVKIESGHILLHPIDHSEGRNVTRLLSSPNGKRMFDIDATNPFAKRFMETIEEGGLSSKEPFFIIRRTDKKGWISIEHYPSDKPPSKNIPYFQVWPLNWSPSTEDAEFGTKHMRQWHQARQLVLAACETVQTHNGGKGRPPKNVQKAKEIMTGLDRLVRDVHKLMGGSETRVLELVKSRTA